MTHYTYEIVQEEFPDNPREQFDHLGTMVCWHRRYDLGDKQPAVSARDWFLSELNLDDKGQTIEELWAKFEKSNIILPLYLYDHSVISISTRSFVGRAQHAEWDSGQVGFIYISHDQARKEYGRQYSKRATTYLEGEVKEYDSYLIGDVWGYRITDDQNNEIESVWGFYGHEYAEQEAQASTKSWNE